MNVVTDIFKEAQPNGVMKWSFLRACGGLWMLFGVLGSLYMKWFKSIEISDNIVWLTVVLVLGVAGGKCANGVQTVAQNYINSK